MSLLIVALLGAVVDSGVIMLSQGGKPLGQEKFEISRTDGGFEEKFESKFGGLSQKGLLRVDAKWRPQSGEFEGGDSKVELRRVDGKLELGNQKESKPSDVFIGNNMLAQLTAVCALAGPKRSLLAFPGVALEMAPAEKRGALTFVQADLMAMVRIEVLCDGPKLIAFRQPLQSVLAVRKGSESVAVFAERKKPPLPEGLIEEPRKVKSGDAVLACSLLLPKQRSGRLPGVTFVTGSGPQDRDEDTPGPGGLKLSIFKTMAIALGEAGIASLRCDDRGVGESTGSLKEVTLDMFVGDARATLAALRAEPAIDPERTGIIGHSEGGVIAPMVASADPKVRAIVLMAGTGRPLDDVLFEQVEREARGSGMSGEQLKKEMDLQRRTTNAIRDGKPLPADLPADKRSVVEVAGPWLRSHFRHDPAKTIAAVKAKVMIAQGAKDTQVSVRDAELLHGAKPDVVYKVYPGLNHLFAKAQTGSITEYSDPNAKVDEGFLKDVVAFLKENLRPPAK